MIEELAEPVFKKTFFSLMATVECGDYFDGKNGFVPVATLPDVHGPGSPGNVFMRKLLR